MQKIPLVRAQSGMVLAQEITNPDNPSSMPICGKGVTLSESLINRLRQMNVQSVVVEGHPVVIEGEETVEQMLEALDRRFRKVTDDPLMMRVRELYRSQIRRSRGVPDA